jgi:cyclophilin family peptidyl-prolyl cis-trans isomerase
VFGKVVQGMDVSTRLPRCRPATLAITPNVPTTPVVIQNVKIISEK